MRRSATNGAPGRQLLQFAKHFMCQLAESGGKCAAASPFAGAAMPVKQANAEMLIL